MVQEYSLLTNNPKIYKEEQGKYLKPRINLHEYHMYQDYKTYKFVRSAALQTDLPQYKVKTFQVPQMLWPRKVLEKGICSFKVFVAELLAGHFEDNLFKKFLKLLKL